MILNTPVRFVSSQIENVKIHSYQTAYVTFVTIESLYFHRQCFYKTYREVRLSEHFNVSFFPSFFKRFVKMSSEMIRFTSNLPHCEYNSDIIYSTREWGYIIRLFHLYHSREYIVCGFKSWSIRSREVSRNPLMAFKKTFWQIQCIM